MIERLAKKEDVRVLRGRTNAPAGDAESGQSEHNVGRAEATRSPPERTENQSNHDQSRAKHCENGPDSEIRDEHVTCAEGSRETPEGSSHAHRPGRAPDVRIRERL